MSSKLIVIGGLPGTGKTSLATGLAGTLDAVHVRIDTIEQALRSSTMAGNAIGAAGYVVAYGIADDNLRLGRIVVADCVNPLASTRAAWRDVARRAAVEVIEVEVICSDASEHRRRIESRASDIAGLNLPTWGEVMAREYEPWPGEHMVIDTAHRSVAECVLKLHAFLLARERS
ncbi:MAG TPA: AAA family ATPase [Casimicrobiaceae bacterium]|jgi:predicted kinase